MTVTDEERTGREPSRLQRITIRVLTYRSDLDGRLLLLGVLATYFAIVAIPRLIWDIDLWPRLGVPSGPSLFFDTRNLTAALECRRLGFDPLMQNPCDPWDRPLNYPRVWLLLRFLGLTQSHTIPLALLFIALFLGSIFLLVGRIGLGKAIVVAIAVCSPSVMFAVERANMDIVVFTLMVLAVLTWRVERPWSEWVSPLVVLVAATAKIYPVFALPAYLFTRRRTAAIAAIACTLLFAVYAFVMLDDIRAVAAIAPQGELHSFGARILPAAIYHRFIPERWQGGAITKQLFVIVPLLAAAALLWLPGRRRRPDRDVGADGSTRLAFSMGSLIFLATFAIGNNFDYRLVFLLLTLPQLFDWVERPHDPRSWLAAVTLVAIVALLWVGALSEPLMLWDEVVTWAVVGLLIVLLAASIPRVRSMAVTIRRPD
jgi:glycosyl transferase family 87